MTRALLFAAACASAARGPSEHYYGTVVEGPNHCDDATLTIQPTSRFGRHAVATGCGWVIGFTELSDDRERLCTIEDRDGAVAWTCGTRAFHGKACPTCTTPVIEPPEDF